MMVWFSNEAIMNIELFIILKIENWPIKRCPEQGGPTPFAFYSFSSKYQLSRLIGPHIWLVLVSPFSGRQPNAVWRWRARGPHTALSGSDSRRRRSLLSSAVGIRPEGHLPLFIQESPVGDDIPVDFSFIAVEWIVHGVGVCKTTSEVEEQVK